jgi:hypothetical protein
VASHAAKYGTGRKSDLNRAGLSTKVRDYPTPFALHPSLLRLVRVEQLVSDKEQSDHLLGLTSEFFPK